MQQEGNDIVTSIDPEAQQTALGRTCRTAGFGAVVAIEPQTGRVKVMASNPPYDPNRIPYELSNAEPQRAETPLLNRATQGLYPPGSTFKVVTAAAALDAGVITPDTTIDAPGRSKSKGSRLTTTSPQDFGAIDARHRPDQLG